MLRGMIGFYGHDIPMRSLAGSDEKCVMVRLQGMQF